MKIIELARHMLKRGITIAPFDMVEDKETGLSAIENESELETYFSSDSHGISIVNPPSVNPPSDTNNIAVLIFTEKRYFYTWKKAMDGRLHGWFILKNGDVIIVLIQHTGKLFGEHPIARKDIGYSVAVRSSERVFITSPKTSIEIIQDFNSTPTITSIADLAEALKIAQVVDEREDRLPLPLEMQAITAPQVEMHELVALNCAIDGIEVEAETLTNELAKEVLEVVLAAPTDNVHTHLIDWCGEDEDRNALLQLLVEARDVDNGHTWSYLQKEIGPIRWAWAKWLPYGLLTIVASDPGTGKSALCLRIAASFLRGDDWPDGEKYRGQTVKIIWAEAEAGQALNLERAQNWGLPLDNILTVAEPLVDVKLDNDEHKKRLLLLAGRPDVGLIIIDSLRGIHSRDENSSEVMSVVKWLAELARDTGKPVLLTHHLRKRGLSDNAEVTLDRLRGSTAIVQPARVVWALDTPNPNLKDKKRLSVIKNNLMRFAEPLGMFIDDEGVHFGDAPVIPQQETTSGKATMLLQTLLAAGPKRATEIQEEFNGAGISWGTAKKVKSKLGIASEKNPKGQAVLGWYWSLPEHLSDKEGD